MKMSDFVLWFSEKRDEAVGLADAIEPSMLARGCQTIGPQDDAVGVRDRDDRCSARSPIAVQPHIVYVAAVGYPPMLLSGAVDALLSGRM